MTVVGWLVLITMILVVFYLWWFLTLLLRHGGPRGLKAAIKEQLK